MSVPESLPPNASNPLRKPDGGMGCWVGGIVTMLLVMTLVLVGIFLPPFSLYDRLFGESYDLLSNLGDARILEGMTFAVASDDGGEDFGVRLELVGLADFELANAEAAEWIPEVKANVPHYLALQSPVYTVHTTGTPPNAIKLTVDLPLNVVNHDLLSLYGWYANPGEWRFIPSHVVENTLDTTLTTLPQHVAVFQTAPLAPTVRIAYDVTQTLTDEVGQLATLVSPAGLQPTVEGTLVGSLAPGFNINAGYRAMPVLRNYADPRAVDTETIVTVLSNGELRGRHVQHIRDVASQSGFDGVFIDYRNLPLEQRKNFSLFIQELNDGLDQTGLLLGVVVPAAIIEDGRWETGAYNWRAIGQAADYLQINMGINPQTFAPGETELVEAMLRWAKGEVDRYKILLGLSAQSIREVSGTMTLIGYDAALAGLGDVQIDAPRSETGAIEPGSTIHASLDGMMAIAGVDTVINVPFIDYQNTDGSIAARLWLTTRDALRYRLDKTIPFALSGVGFENLLTDDLADGIQEAIINYKAQIPAAPAPTDLALRWQVEGSEGVIEEIVTGLNEDLTIQLSAPDGNYAINVAVIGIGQQTESLRSGDSVALFSATNTPTPLPTSTPTPVPTITPSPIPIVLTNTPVPGAPAPPSGGAPTGGGFGAAPPPAGSIGSFEYGGHVTSTGSGRAIGAMQRAGMTWMKEQVRFYPGDSPGAAIAAVNNAHANGFRILIGTVGDPTQLQQGGQGYIDNYLNWLASIAASGADAIEVWNEPNLDREWPEGQISGASYTNMLRQAYAAIKSGNPNTLVVSAAPAPTGAEAAFPGKVVNDNRFLQEMVNSGALNYLDCVGAHYNEGIIPPSQTSGDPRDSYYTRYFWGMVNTYWGITGRPICFTELGYLTSEGYPPLPDFFGWAQHVTVGQQAAWIAEATSLAANSGGKVRLIIVWNIDFQHYSSDPQAGYALVRPGGGCPACDALAAAR